MSLWGRRSAEADVYIDLGTANTLVVSKSKGLVVNEPSVIAFRETESGKRAVVAVGSDAKSKIGRTPGNLTASYPLRDGVIADLDITEAMLTYFLARARGRFDFARPRTVISLPYGVTDVEKEAVRQAGLGAGAAEVYLIDEPMAAAIGSDLPVAEPRGNMVIDIGGGTSEIAVISLFGIVHCEAVRVGGHAFDQEIVSYVRRNHGLLVGDQSAENLKISIGTALPGDDETRATIRGLDFVTGLPRAVTVSAAEVHYAMSGLLRQIVEAARRTIEQVPPDLVPDVVRDGLVLAGGGALMRGLRERLEMELKIPVRISPDPLLAIARGGARAIADKTLLDRIMIA
jgi:rod shape-determining protein MreB